MNSEPGKYVSAKEVDPTRPATTLDISKFKIKNFPLAIYINVAIITIIITNNLFLAILCVHPIDVVARIESILTEAWPACHMIKHKLLKCEILYIPIAFDDDSFGVLDILMLQRLINDNFLSLFWSLAGIAAATV